MSNTFFIFFKEVHSSFSQNYLTPDLNSNQHDKPQAWKTSLSSQLCRRSLCKLFSLETPFLKSLLETSSSFLFSSFLPSVLLLVRRGSDVVFLVFRRFFLPFFIAWQSDRCRCWTILLLLDISTESPNMIRGWSMISLSQKQESFLKPLVDQYAKEGKDKKVVFEANFSKPNCKPKWFFRKDVSVYSEIIAT